MGDCCCGMQRCNPLQQSSKLERGCSPVRPAGLASLLGPPAEPSSMTGMAHVLV